MKKYRIKIDQQWFDFDYFPDAQTKAIQLLANGAWYFKLETIDPEKKEEIVEKPKKTRGKTKRYKLNYKKIYGEPKKKAKVLPSQKTGEKNGK